MRCALNVFQRFTLSAVCLMTSMVTIGCAPCPCAAANAATPQPVTATQAGVPVVTATAPSPSTAPTTDAVAPAGEGGIAGTARGSTARVAFCCDTSGSMIDKFVTLKDELEMAIEGLQPTHAFSLVFFGHNGRVDAFDDGAMTPATPENKRQAYKWTEDLTTNGSADPIPAIELAFKGQPDLMYILTDGDIENKEETLARLAELNPEQDVRVSAVAFFSSRDDEATRASSVRFLRTLAERNDGRFRVAMDETEKPDKPE